MVKAVIFDLDDTLVMEQEATEEAFQAAGFLACQRYGLNLKEFTSQIKKTAETIWEASPIYDWCQKIGISAREGLWADFMEDIARVQILKEWIPWFRLQSWQKTLHYFGIEDNFLAEKMSACYITECQKRHRVFPEVLPVLSSLRHYRLGMITNGLHHHQWKKILSNNLTGFFETVVISSDVGYGKPHPVIFQEALSCLMVEPEEACMVGDSLENDIAGAKAVSLRAIWINRSKNPVPVEIKPDAVISSLSFLQEILAGF